MLLLGGSSQVRSSGPRPFGRGFPHTPGLGGRKRATITMVVMNHLPVLEMILLFRNLHGKFVSPFSLVTQHYRVTFVHLRALLMSFHSWKNMRNICRQWWMKKAIQGSMPLPKSLVKPWNVTEHKLNWLNIYEHVGSILDDLLFLFEYVLKSVGVCVLPIFLGGVLLVLWISFTSFHLFIQMRRWRVFLRWETSMEEGQSIGLPEGIWSNEEEGCWKCGKGLRRSRWRCQSCLWYGGLPQLDRFLIADHSSSCEFRCAVVRILPVFACYLTDLMGIPHAIATTSAPIWNGLKWNTWSAGI